MSCGDPIPYSYYPDIGDVVYSVPFGIAMESGQCGETIRVNMSPQNYTFCEPCCSAPVEEKKPKPKIRRLILDEF